MRLRPPRKPPERKRPPEKRRCGGQPLARKDGPLFSGKPSGMLQNLGDPQPAVSGRSLRCRGGGEGRSRVRHRQNGTLTDLKVTHCEERHFADRLCKTIALSPKWSPGRTKGKPVKTELEMRFVFRLVAPPAGQEELGLCAEECDIHTTANRMPLFCGAVRTGFVRGCSGRSTA